MSSALAAEVQQFKAIVGDASIADVDARRAIRKAGSLVAAIDAWVRTAASKYACSALAAPRADGLNVVSLPQLHLPRPPFLACLLKGLSHLLTHLFEVL